MKRGVFLFILSLPISFAGVLDNIENGFKRDLPLLVENKYTFLILLMITISIITSMISWTNKRKLNKKGTYNDYHLFNQTLDHLENSEKKICEVLDETNGVSEEFLMNKLNLNENKLKNSLKVLEKKQIIKERKDKNPKIYLSDWLRD